MFQIIIRLLAFASISGACLGMTMPAEPIPTSERSELAWEHHAERLTGEMATRSLMFGAPIYVRIFKESRELELWVESADGYRLFRNYPICSMSGILGPKLRRGDWQAPEGFYEVSAEWMNPNSRFHLSFNIGYPNDYDRARGRTGSNIMVHGGCDSRGCFAMTDQAMEEIYVLAEAALRHSQQSFPVHVFPFRMTEANMARHDHRRWMDFWESLKPAHDWLEQHNQPPTVAVTRRGYRLEFPPPLESPRLVHFGDSPTEMRRESAGNDKASVSPR
jgi:murein L,D-transpeptidase YafK